MPFIGTQPDVGGYSVLDNLTASATASYTLQKDSANFVPSSANQLLVSLNGVIQKPGSSFTVSGSTLTFSSALTSGDSIDFILAMGEPLLVGVPSDATITGSKLASNIGISTTGNIATTGSGTLSVAGTAAITGNTTVAGTLTNTGLITASAGVAIGGTGAANTLDDYEEGTWTANLIGSTGNPSTAATSTAATYTKVGRMVYARWMMGAADVAGASGGIRVNGLPFNNSGGHVSGNIMMYYRKSANADAINLTPYVTGNTIYFYQTRDGYGDVWAEILFDLIGASTNFYMYASVVYETAT